MTGSDKVYQLITDQMIELLEQGEVPWRKPWTADWPRNLSSKREYHGVNVIMLGVGGALSGYTSNWWSTYRQSAELHPEFKEWAGRTALAKDGKPLQVLQKGAKGLPVVYFKMLKVANRDDGYKRVDLDNPDSYIEIPMARYSRVFNFICTTLPESVLPVEPGRKQVDPIQAAEDVVAGWVDKPAINHGGNRVGYFRMRDLVVIPERDRFTDAEHYYNNLFHELGHSTGHPKRLARYQDGDLPVFGSCDYSKEELIAELTAAFICGRLGIAPATIKNSAGYIQNWLTALKDSDNRKWVVCAGSAAAKAADMIVDGHKAPVRYPIAELTGPSPFDVATTILRLQDERTANADLLYADS